MHFQTRKKLLSKEAIMTGQTTQIINKNGYLENASVTGYNQNGEMFGIADLGVLNKLKVGQGFHGFFTELSNNQYFSSGHLVVSESISRFGAYSLQKALSPDYSVNFTILDDHANPYRMTTVAGIKMKPATAATLSKVAKFGGYFLAGVSLYATESQYADGTIGETERIMNHMMTGVGLVPTPWTMGIALGYGVITGGYQAITGRSIFNDIGLGPQ